MRFIHSSIFILLISGCCGSNMISNNNTISMKNQVVAHRGAWKKKSLPENSIASLKQAIALKCAGSEFDIRMSVDDSLVINHDPDLHGMVIEKTNYTELIKIKLSNGEKLPTLREYLQAGLENNASTILVAEIKPSGISKERGKLIAEKVLAMVDEMNANSRVVYISFDYDILRKIHELNPNAITQYLEGNKSPDELKADGISGADYHYSVFRNKPEWIASAKKLGLQLNAWTVNNAGDMDWLLQNGFDQVTTNEPELLFERIRLMDAKKD